MKQRAILVLLIGLLLPGAAWAQLSLHVDYGWGERLRAGRWTPVFVTLSDTHPRNVLITVYAPLDQYFSTSIEQQVTVGPEPATFTLLAPLSYALDETVVTIREARPGGRTLARRFLRPPGEGWYTQRERFVDAGAVFIGTTGNRSMVRLLQEQFNLPGVFSDYLAPRRLPVSAAGYDGLDVVLLNQPELSGTGQQVIGVAAQQAMADWVRSGGVLVVVPGADFSPGAGPLGELMPALDGANVEISLSAEQLSAAGLAERFAVLNARQMQPRAGAQRIALLNDDTAVAYRQRVGFGQVVLLSFDVSGLQFRRPEDAAKFWKAALANIITFPDTATPGHLSYQPEDQRKTLAVQHTMDLLGNVPGVGSFSFSYVAIVMIGLMLLVGPVDWLVLKWTGRQPWTWVTTAGWIGLITFGAIYIGTVVRSGELHFRTLRLIDQADGSVQAHHDFAGIYSNRSMDYRIETPPTGWWKPPATSGYWSSGGMRNDLRFDQDYRGNHPRPMRVHVWNLRFLEAQRPGRGPEVLSADLRINGQQLEGTIVNRGERPVTDLVARSGDRVWRFDQPVGAGETASVSAAPHTGRNLFAPVEHDFNTTPWQGHYGVRGQLPERPQYSWATDLAVNRSRRIEKLLRNDSGIVVLYGTIEQSSPAASINRPDAKEQHWQVIRAVLPLQSGEGDAP